MGALGPVLVFLPAIENAIFQKSRHKKYAFVAIGANGLEIILVLLTEVIVFHVQILIIEIQVPSFERPIRNIFSRFY